MHGIREVFSPTNPNTPNQITTIVGNGTFGFNGDGAVGTAIELTNPPGCSLILLAAICGSRTTGAIACGMYTASTKIGFNCGGERRGG